LRGGGGGRDRRTNVDPPGTWRPARFLTVVVFCSRVVGTAGRWLQMQVSQIGLLWANAEPKPNAKRVKARRRKRQHPLYTATSNTNSEPLRLRDSYTSG